MSIWWWLVWWSIRLSPKSAECGGSTRRYLGQSPRRQWDSARKAVCHIVSQRFYEVSKKLATIKVVGFCLPSSLLVETKISPVDNLTSLPSSRRLDVICLSSQARAALCVMVTMMMMMMRTTWGDKRTLASVPGTGARVYPVPAPGPSGTSGCWD